MRPGQHGTASQHKNTTLYPGTWLNDEIINFCMDLLRDRDKSSQALPKVDIFAKDILLVPINESYHWVLAVIDMRKKRIYVYDSLGGSHRDMLKRLWNYLESEHQDKKKEPFDYTEWELMILKNVPQQQNSSDCGVFICTFAERLAREGEMNFRQKDMPVLRQGMVLDILNKQV
ncbi:cysteine proteinase [Backusella circina FSU 941]|nr:cysteine proteinase [Backusella circina FSU 941]